jgi:F420-non-reducing hydrogenase iron-sulfur subunit
MEEELETHFGGEPETEQTVEDVKIIGLLCNWCSYAGADLAGTSRFQYAPKIRIVRVMCSGRIDPALILQAFKNRADGVLIGGCHFGDCHYIDGNYHAYQKIKFLERMLSKAGIDSRRMRLEWISAAEGKRFAEVVNDFTQTIKDLGKVDLSGEKMDLLDALITVFSDFRVRWILGKKLNMIQDGNVYGSKFEDRTYGELLEEIVETEFLRVRILRAIENEPLPAPEIAKKLSRDSEEIMANLITMLGDRKVAMQFRDHNAYFIKEEA